MALHQRRPGMGWHTVEPRHHDLTVVLSLGEWLIFALAVAAGAVVQNLVGFGLALLVSPIVGIVRPDLMPAMMILLSFPLSIEMAIRGWANIDWVNLGWSMVARVPTIALGAWLVTMVSNRALGGLVGAMVVVSCAISALGSASSITRPRAVGAGAVSGFMETTAGVGGAPMALLYQHRPAPEIRATLAASFLGGKSLAFVALAAGGELRASALGAAVWMFPALVAGSLIARPLVQRLGGRSVRPAVLMLCAITGSVALVDALIG